MIAANSLGLGSCWIHRAKETFETEEGKQCKRMAAPRCFFCTQHESGKKLVDPKKEIGQCRAVTDDGKQCSRKAVTGWRYCEQHRK